ncbi:CsgG/HfaB family protein [Shigella flexneri]|uniref:Curli production assembly/transport component CsgG n=2 Tax=Shigella TaxID=620 RepID=A0A6N3R2H6_SHIFL|nr:MULTISPECIES: CsgG/HfaB family protein [Shigella]EGI99185.1 curli production assembly/transport subunit CsgG domain protein [Shigella boydii 3594-74]EIQ10095.1 curli production assembly/transport component CsgG domain protein [Shigella flexneri CCH060]EIQ37806.1 curli production assembly/transport component CsgG domain protein [Shigella boydii 4444-74]OOO75083.1 curli production assembly protein CsgG [Shigella boydii]
MESLPVSVYNIQDETGQFKPYPASNFSTAVPQSATAMLVTALKDSRWFIPLER